MKKYVSIAKASELTGLHPQTLRKYEREGKIDCYKLPSGERRFNVDSFLGAEPQSSVIIYARVNTSKQKEDLQRQISFLQENYQKAEVISDIGSGLNFKRKGLNSILERAICGERIKLIVSYRDRLARFGFELIEKIIQLSGGEVLVQFERNQSSQQELVNDLLAIITVFSSRVHGLRNYRDAIKKDPNIP